MKRSVKYKRRPLNSSQLIALVFFGIIVIGTALLMLPFASRNGVSAGLRVALFTATSSTCVTGLILADTWTQWSGFGQIVIITLIEIGGLGFMSAASFFIFAFRRKVNMNQQMIIAQSIGSDDIGDTVRMQKRIISGCLLVEGAGAAILTARLAPVYDFRNALKLGVFHSVSAFCNAGFDIFGFEAPGSSISVYGTDFIVIITLSLLIIIGGLGFLVWDEILRVKNAKRWSVYTKLVLITSGALIVFGWIIFCVLEWNNPATIGDMSFGEKLIASLFQSVTTRTAGFAGVDQGSLTDGGKAVTIFLMLIGGSSGST
ncbi:MAG: Trk family potassium uptake protein, partial [Oscillospiraceae bacterium]|nr:Trk family potassium uptake protein [Oscillospiraceae bacterium]